MKKYKTGDLSSCFVREGIKPRVVFPEIDKTFFVMINKKRHVNCDDWNMYLK